MAFEYRYGVYNPGQYRADMEQQWAAMAADGWQIHTAAPTPSEVTILWQRELPDAGNGAEDGKKRPAQGDA